MYTTTNQKSNAILKLYREDVNLTEICKVTSSSQFTVKKVLSNAGINYNEDRKIRYQEKLEQVVKLYKEGKSQNYIEKTLKLTRKTIRETLKKADVEYRDKSEQQHLNNKTVVNHEAFDELTPESLYWIGMLYTDGGIENVKEQQVCLTLHNNDKDHLVKLQQFFKTTRPIVPDHGDCSRLRVNSKKLVTKLVELNFTPNKSRTIIPHDDLKNSRDFWRGCIDGDGGIYVKGDVYEVNIITLCGTLETIFEFIIFLNSNLDINSKYPSPTSSETLYQIHYYGQEALKVANLLYENSSVYLERKYKNYTEILNSQSLQKH